MIIIGRELERIMSVAVWHNNIIMLDIVPPPPPPPPTTIVMFTGVTAVHMVMTGEGGVRGGREREGSSIIQMTAGFVI